MRSLSMTVPPDKIFARTVLRVRDVAESVVYYCETLGFEKDWQSDDAAVAQVSRGGVSLLLIVARFHKD